MEMLHDREFPHLILPEWLFFLLLLFFVVILYNAYKELDHKTTFIQEILSSNTWWIVDLRSEDLGHSKMNDPSDLLHFLYTKNRPLK